LQIFPYINTVCSLSFFTGIGARVLKALGDGQKQKAPFENILINSYQMVLGCFCFHPLLDFYFNLTPGRMQRNYDKTGC